MGWAGDETGTVSAGGEGPKAGPGIIACTYCVPMYRVPRYHVW